MLLVLSLSALLTLVRTIIVATTGTLALMVESVIKFDGRESNIFKFSSGSAIYKSTEFFEMTINPIFLMLISIIVSYIIVY